MNRQIDAADLDEIVIVFGKRGYGKTYFSKSYIRKFKRVIIIDALKEYGTDDNISGIIFEHVYDLIDWIEKYGNKEKFILICRFKSIEQIEAAFEIVEAVGNVLLVLEEAGMYISPGTKKSKFLDLVRFGRHYAISLLAISRRTVELSTEIRAAGTKIISFKQNLPRDIKIMNDLGLTGLENLPRGEYKEIEY